MISFLFSLSLAFADSPQTTVTVDPNTQIEKAYQREYAYLAAEKRELKSRISTANSQQGKLLSKMEDDIVALEGSLATKRLEREVEGKRILKMEESVSSLQQDTESFLTVLAQGERDRLGENREGSVAERFDTMFKTSLMALKENASVKQARQKILNTDGVSIEADVLKIGQVAAYANVDGQTAPLRPIGKGDLQMISDYGAETAAALFTNKNPSILSMQLVEGFERSVDEDKPDAFLDTMEKGGVVAWVIVGLGLFGLLLGLIRLILLSGARKRATVTVFDALEPVKVAVDDNVSTLPTADALGHERMVDRAEALLLKARTNMERFGMAIMVIAAVAPLLGLLGTVSGMISTFAIITEHGTGDPKLLSGGISEALITTQLGLMVAIPLLLLGNLLNGWCGRISANLEEKVLMRIANYKPQSAPPPTKSNQDKQYA